MTRSNAILLHPVSASTLRVQATIAALFFLIALLACKPATAQITFNPPLTQGLNLQYSVLNTKSFEMQEELTAGSNNVTQLTWSVQSGNTVFTIDTNTSITTCTSTLNAGTSCYIGVQFTPTVIGTTSSYVNISFYVGTTQYNTSFNVSGAGINAQAALYANSTTGNDSWSGTQLNAGSGDGPKATFDGLRQGVRGIVCPYQTDPCVPTSGVTSVTATFEGNYTYNVPANGEQFTEMDSGSSSLPITYTNQSGDTPVISGGTTVAPGTSNWTCNESTNVCTTNLSRSTAFFEQIWGQTPGNQTPILRHTMVAPFTNGGQTPGYFYNDGRVTSTTASACGSDPNDALLVYAKPATTCGGTGTNPYYICTNQFYVKYSDIHLGDSPGTIDPGWSGWSLSNPNDPIEVIDFEDWTVSRMRTTSLVTYTDSPVYLAGDVYTAPPNSNDYVMLLAGPANAGDYWGFPPGHRYLLDNVKDVIASNKAGQFFAEQTSNGNLATLSYVPASGENVGSGGTTTIILPQASSLLTVNPATGFGFHNVTFSNLTFSYANWVAANPAITGLVGYSGLYNSMDLWPNPSGNGQVDASVQNQMPAALTFTNSSYITLTHDTFSHNAGYGIDFLGADPTYSNPQSACTSSALQNCNNIIENNTFTDLGGGALRIGQLPGLNDSATSVPQYNLVYNNLLYSGDRELPGAALFVGNSHHNAITQNTIYDFYNTGINIGHSLNYDGCGGFVTSGTEPPATCTPYSSNQVFDNEINDNLVFNLGQGVTEDMGGIHMANGDRGGNVIENNVFHDISQGPNDTAPGESPDPYGYGGWGIYLDQGSSYETIKNNLAYNTSASGFKFNPINPCSNGEQSNPRESNTDGSNQTSVISNNIFALGSIGSSEVNGNDYALFGTTTSYPDFGLRQNIFYWDDDVAGIGVGDSVYSSPMYGPWQCTTGTNGTGTDVALSKCYALEENMYYSVPGVQTYVNDSTCNNINGNDSTDTWCFYYGDNLPGSSVPDTYYSLSSWQSSSMTNEDSNSAVNSNPGFTDVTPPNDYNFGLTQGTSLATLPPSSGGISFAPITFTTGSSLGTPTQLLSVFPTQTWTNFFAY